MKKLWILLFTLCGSIVSSWLSPKWIKWFYQSPVSTGVDCSPALEWAMQVLLVSQGIGAVFGLFTGIIVTYWIESRKKIAR